MKLKAIHLKRLKGNDVDKNFYSINRKNLSKRETQGGKVSATKYTKVKGNK